jgi:hypothetical protein
MMAYRMISIDSDSRRVGIVELFHPDDVRLFTDELMLFAGKLNMSDDLYAIEDRVARHYFSIGNRTIYGTGLVVGRAGSGFLQQPCISLAEVTEAVEFGSLAEPIRRRKGYFRPSRRT